MEFRLLHGDSLEELLKIALKDIRDYGITTAPRGRESKEILGYNFVLENPLNRLVGFKARNLNPFYLVGNLLWVLGQSNKLNFINYYNPKGSMFSDDGEILPAAYGKRIFDIDGINQWQNCVNELKLDPNSRRAIINIHMAQYDWRGVLDTSCTSDFQFFIRDGYLDMINHMRSQSGAFVMPYDIFLMTMLHELMARELGVKLGAYHHFCNSLHYFSNEKVMVEDIINSNDYTSPMREMPKDTTYSSLKPLLIFEKELREAAQSGNFKHELSYITKLHNMDYDKYWNQFGYVLIAKALHYTNHINYEKFVKEYISQTDFSTFFQL